MYKNIKISSGNFEIQKILLSKFNKTFLWDNLFKINRWVVVKYFILLNCYWYLHLCYYNHYYHNYKCNYFRRQCRNKRRRKLSLQQIIITFFLLILLMSFFITFCYQNLSYHCNGIEIYISKILNKIVL